MMSEKLIKMMAEESEETAIWCSIIHWWEMRNLPAFQANCYCVGFDCSLCIRSDGVCASCPLSAAVGARCGAGEPNPFKAAKTGAREGNEAEWRLHSGRMLNVLLSLVGMEVVKQFQAKYKAEPKEEPACKTGDTFEWAGGDYILACLGAGPHPKNLKVTMISKIDGNRLTCPKFVSGNLSGILLSDIYAAFPNTKLVKEETSKS